MHGLVNIAAYLTPVLTYALPAELIARRWNAITIIYAKGKQEPGEKSVGEIFPFHVSKVANYAFSQISNANDPVLLHYEHLKTGQDIPAACAHHDRANQENSARGGVVCWFTPACFRYPPNLTCFVLWS